jgi:uncharacterized protein (TIGR03435 family)
MWVRLLDNRPTAAEPFPDTTSRNSATATSGRSHAARARTSIFMTERNRGKTVLLRVTSGAVAAVLLVAGLTVSSRCQGQSIADEKAVRPSFEVVSIRGHEPGYWPTFERRECSADGFDWINAQPQAIIVYAYHLRDPKLGPNLIPGAPKWIRSDWYDIRAKLSDSDVKTLAKLTSQERDDFHRRLLQSMLADRFKLKAHLVSKESLAYELVVAKSGVKNLKQASPGEKPHVDWVDAGDGQYHGVPLDALVMLLKMQEDCPVVDKTGLTGKYDFELKWDRTPETMPPAGTSVVPAAPSEDASRASIFTALQEQLGLKLIPIKSQLESIVIDHIEKPSAN